MSEIEAVCDRAAIIHRGRLQACGTIPELTENRERVEVTLEVPDSLVSQFPWTEEGLHRATLARGETDEYLQRALHSGCSVRHVSTQHTSLEEIFYDITRKLDQQEGVACVPS